jgi:hypothetical protein
MYSRAGAHNDPKQWLCYLMRPAMELHDARNWVMPAISAPFVRLHLSFVVLLQVCAGEPAPCSGGSDSVSTVIDARSSAPACLGMECFALGSCLCVCGHRVRTPPASPHGLHHRPVPVYPLALTQLVNEAHVLHDRSRSSSSSPAHTSGVPSAIVPPALAAGTSGGNVVPPVVQDGTDATARPSTKELVSGRPPAPAKRKADKGEGQRHACVSVTAMRTLRLVAC